MRVASLLLLGWVGAVGFGADVVTSPDGRLVVTLSLEDRGGQTGCPTWSVGVGGRPLLAPAGLGVRMADRADWTCGFTRLGAERRGQDATWRPVYGERAVVRDHYRELTWRLGREPAGAGLDVTVRCYDTGVALRYRLTKPAGAGGLDIAEERTAFRFTADHPAWSTTSAQGRYRHLPLSQLGREEERPLVVQAREDLYVAVGEAALVDYARTKLARDPDRPYTLVTRLSSAVRASGALLTPWRVLLIGPSPAALLEGNDLFLNLNAPCALDDTSWIRPGKVIREVTLTTRGGRACVDFAARHGLQYVEYDAGWYGRESDETSDARTVTVDPKRSRGPLDLQEVIDYGRQRDIGILLYVNRRALERQLDEILPLFRRWGVAGVKYGFVQVGSQRWTTWLHEAVRKAAANRLMVDIHDEYRPTGVSRTYPNLMTQEGIRGDETSPTNDLTLTILFTRMLAGAGDNTICYFNERVDRNASHAYQLAKAVCLYSPWQFLYWYDRPAASSGEGGAGGSRGVIVETPDLAFFDHVPTVWDDTRVLHGAIGRYAVIARRSGDAWFIGGMNHGEARTLPVALDFLPAGRPYIAHLYTDDPAVATPTHVRVSQRPVDASTVLHEPMGPQGGFAVHLEPAPTGGATRRIDLAHFRAEDWDLQQVRHEVTTYQGRTALHLGKPPELEQDGVTAVFRGLDFADGTIEFDMASRVFSGLVFRAQDDGRAECVYFRPFNAGTAKHGHTVQYVARGTPDTWRHLRETAPGRYEAGADIEVLTWFHVRLAVAGRTVKVFVDDAAEPCLVVNDMKLAADHGRIGLWSWEGYFANLTVTPAGS